MSLFQDAFLSDNSDVDESELPPEPSNVTVIAQSCKKHFGVESQQQFGGSVVTRQDGSQPVVNSLPFSDDEVATTIRVTKLLGEHLHLFRRLASLKPLRAALHPLVQEQMANGGYGESGDASKGRGARKRGRRGQGHLNEDARERQTALEKVLKEREEAYINSTQLRAVRLKQLEDLYEQDRDGGEREGAVMRVPDGAVLTLEDGPSEHSAGGSSVLLLGTTISSPSPPSSSCEVLTVKGVTSTDTTSTASTIAAMPGDAGPPSLSHSRDGENLGGNKLLSPLDCYICKKPFIDLHFFYASLCPDCAAFNYMKRSEKVNNLTRTPTRILTLT